MITLKFKDTGQQIGELTEDQLQFLIDELVEEHIEDKDYWLHKTQIESFKASGADPQLITMLETAFGDKDDIEIIWERN